LSAKINENKEKLVKNTEFEFAWDLALKNVAIMRKSIFDNKFNQNILSASNFFRLGNFYILMRLDAKSLADFLSKSAVAVKSEFEFVKASQSTKQKNARLTALTGMTDAEKEAFNVSYNLRYQQVVNFQDRFGTP